jgi:hypothetical protein
MVDSQYNLLNLIKAIEIVEFSKITKDKEANSNLNTLN